METVLSLSSHLPDKFFQISYTELKGYDQCLSLQSTHYCQTSLLPKDRSKYPHWFSLRYNMTVHIGFCLPNICPPNEVENLINEVVQSFDWEKVHFHGCQSPSTFIERLTKSNSSQFRSFVFLSGIIFIVIIASIIDYFHLYSKVYGLNWIKYFALQNTHRTLIFSPAKNRFQLMDHFRIFISLMFLCVHSFAVIAIQNIIFTTESLDSGKDIISSWIIQPVNSDWIYGGLIYLAASSATNSLWHTIDVNTPITTYLRLFIKKLIFFWPVTMVVIAMKIVLPLLGTGPVYSQHTQWRSDVCSSNWFYTLLHVHNYLDTFDMCIGPFWSMNAELHLFIVALIFIYLYKVRPKLAYTLNVIIMIFSLVLVFNTYYSNKLVYRLIGYKFQHWEQIENYVSRTYVTSESHLFTYSLAILVGCYILQNPSLSLGMPKIISQSISCSLIILVIMVAFSPGLWNVLKLETTPFWYSLHAVACKIIVSFGFAWITYLGSRDEKVYKILTKSNEKLDSNTNSNVSKSFHHDDKSITSTSIGYKLLYATARATFFAHWPVYVWFYAHKTKIDLNIRFFTDISYLITLGYLSGLILYYFVLGPYENIISSFKIRKSGKSD